MTEPMDMNLDAVVTAGGAQISREISGEAFILQLDDGVYFSLDGVGALVWDLVQEPRTVRELRDRIVSAYDVDTQRCENDLFELIAQLRARNLVDVRHEPAP